MTSRIRLPFSKRQWYPWAGLLLAAWISLALLLAWVSSGFHATAGWPTFAGFGLVAAGLLAAAWQLLRQQETLPRRLLYLVIGAALLRLTLGAVWTVTLPRFGYGSDSEKAGYIMVDAFKRDQAAWELARSDQPLSSAYTQYRKADQYAGTLLVSAALYRLFGAETHFPLAMVVITSTFSALAILVTWAFARRAWNERSATLAAWGLALYPEAVLQGSTQMREAFLITLVMAGFYGLVCYRQQHSWKGPAWMIVSLLLALFISPPSAGLFLAALGLAAFASGSLNPGHKPATSNPLPASQRKSRLLFWIVLLVVAALILVGSYFALKRLNPHQFDNPIELLTWWFQRSGELQARLTRRASGWIQKIFRATPDWLHTPLLLAYGSLQPFLPAALADVTGAPIWRLIGIWRAVGWSIVLPLLIYAPLRAFSRKHGDALARALSLAAWLVILVAAFRAGADLWDNVRYRATFAGIQIALLAWAWVSQARSPDPWLRRALILVLNIFAWFLPWYLMRYVYLPWPVKDPFVTLGCGIATALLWMVIDALRARRARKTS